MNKQELIAAVSEASTLSKADTAKAVEAVFDVITQVLQSGDEVRLVGFGTFAVTTRKAAKGRNPRTGEEIDISSSKTPKFRAGKVLKDALNS
jgi:DNA-binding protein HU-beta